MNEQHFQIFADHSQEADDAVATGIYAPELHRIQMGVQDEGLEVGNVFFPQEMVGGPNGYLPDLHYFGVIKPVDSFLDLSLVTNWLTDPYPRRYMADWDQQAF